jgi:uncharacterized membrane protein
VRRHEEIQENKRFEKTLIRRSRTMVAASTRIPDVHRYPETRPTNINQTNVGDAEQLISLIAGSALVGYGLVKSTLGGLGLAAIGGMLVHRGMTGTCQLYSALGIDTSDKHSPQASIPAGDGTKVEESITINRSSEELFAFWRQFENLPQVMSNLESVERIEPNRYRWKAKGPLGSSVSWEAEVISERANELIGWRSLQGSEVDTAGSVHFVRSPDGRGTQLRISLKYNPPGGKAGAIVAWLTGSSAQQQIRADLQRFKERMESGQMAMAR